MAEGGVAIPGLETQCKLYKESLLRPLVKGEHRYLISNKWTKQFMVYVGFNSCNTRNFGEQSSHPGPIDNSSLFKDEGDIDINEGLMEELDYTFATEDMWTTFIAWYGLINNHSQIRCPVIEIGSDPPLLQVEVHRVELHLCQNTDIDKCIVKTFSKVDTLEHIEKEMRALFKIPDDKETRIWSRYGACSIEQLSDKLKTLNEAVLYSKQILIIEVKKDDGTWQLRPKNANGSLTLKSTFSISENKQSINSTTVAKNNLTAGSRQLNFCYSYNGGCSKGSGDYRPGLCGLSNLGNTCFMNSALQCMSNTPPLTQYFIDNVYWNEVNSENPLGMKGEIAKAFADLVREIWSGKQGCTTPRTFKMQVGRFAPQFSGYQQQDAQELMAFLLDGLHEDLNRIMKKPYVELRDADGRSDEVVAKEAWDNYRKRNDSIIVDIFHGLLKSTVVCPECGKVSVTFDPFCYLTLPLPVKKERHIDVCFVPLNPTETPVRYKLTLPYAGCISDLCDALHKFTNVSSNMMVVASIYAHKFEKLFLNEEGLSNIMDRDYIYVYEVPVASLDDPEMIVLPVYMRQKRYYAGCSNENRVNQLFSQPFLAAVSRNDCKYGDLYQAILERMQRYVKVPSPGQEWWIKTDENNVLNGEVEMSNGDDDDSPTGGDDSKEDDEGIDSQEETESGRNTDNGFTSRPLFTMHFVNCSGSSELEKIKDDGRHIRFSSRPYVAIDWHPLAKDEFYDEKMAEDVDQHDSMSLSNRMMLKSHVIQVNECLELFTAKERLSKEDSWYCPSCKKHQQATKKFDLWSLPQVLVLCFKRFSYSRYLRDKIDTLVEFPPRGLNMNKYIINKSHGPATYDLIGVCNHFGGMGGGHYTAFAKNKDDSKWYNFDDSTVSPAKEEAVVSKAAYVLFYIRRDSKAAINQPFTGTTFLPREIPAAAGTPDNRDNGIGGSDSRSCSEEEADEENEDNPMDIN